MTQIYGSGKYKYGLCHVFAIALHRVYGYQIAVLEDNDREMVNTRLKRVWPYTPHVFCVKGDYIIDAVGVRKPNTMIKETGKWPIKHPKIRRVDPRTLYNSTLFRVEFERITKKNIREADEFVLKHRAKYKV